MDGKITYHQQVSYCGKPRCRRCREGIGHGPYWYAYQTINGRTVRTYVGKEPPAEIVAAQQAEAEVVAPSRFANTVLRLYLLGQFRLEQRGSGQNSAVSEWEAVSDPSLQHQRVRALLSCLASAPNRKLAREQVIYMLWPELDQETASHRLDRAVHSLRQVFEPGRSRPATSTLLLTEHQTLALADQTQFWIDADAFENLVVQARATNDPGQIEQLLEEASQLYTGDFLPDDRQIEWVQSRRESLRRGWISLLLELADLRITREATSGAIDVLDRLLAVDSANEAAVQRLVVLLAQMGRRGESIQAYQRFASVLKQDYKIAPLPETRTLYEAILRGSTDVSLPHTRPIASADLLSTPPSTPAIVPDHMYIGRIHQSPLVGREDEITRLNNFLQITEQTRRLRLTGPKKSSLPAPMSLDTQRRPQCIMLMGDVGMGKTRLAEEGAREAKRRNWALAWCRAYVQESNVPYRLWTETLRKAMTQGLWQRQEVTRRPLIYQPLRSLLPELQDLLPQSLQVMPPPPEQEQLRLWESTRALLSTICENTTLLIVLDDLQWADSSSCELLTYLVRQMRGQPIMFLCTCRDTELPANHHLRPLMTDLQREQAIELLPVKPLSDEQIRTLVSHLPEPVVKSISTRASGNPFFAEELARGVASGDLADFDPTNPETLPETISAVLDLRLARITPQCQRLLERGAVLGGEFKFETICAMASGGVQADEDVILDLLEEALQAGMLTEEGSGMQITYHFWHPLLFTYLYEHLSAARRASLHRRAAQVLQEYYADNEAEGAGDIADHYFKGGGTPAQVAHYAELAADRAYSLSAYPSAEKYYRLALDHLGNLTAATPQDQRLHRAYILERLGECTMIVGKFEETRNFYEQVLAVRGQNRVFASAEEEQYEAQLRALFLCEVGQAWVYVGDNEQAKKCFKQAESTLLNSSMVDGPAWARIRFQQGNLLWREGSLEEALKLAQKALELFEVSLANRTFMEAPSSLTRTQRTLKGDPVDLGRVHTVISALEVTLGRNVDALAHLDTALAIYEKYDRQREIAIVCSNQGDIYLRQSRYTLAQSAFQRTLDIAEKIGDIPSLSIGFGNLGVLSTRLGNLVEAESWYKKALILAEQINDLIYVSLWNGYLASVLQEQGKVSEARLSLSGALRVSRVAHIPPCTGFALVILGHLHIIQAINVNKNMAVKEKNLSHDMYKHYLNRARVSLKCALTYEGLEAETRIDGELTLAEVALLFGDLEDAYTQASQVLREAEECDLIWLMASSQRLIGRILVAQSQQPEAIKYFQQALVTFEKNGMRLERARTLQAYSLALRQMSQDPIACQDDLQHLQEAKRIFAECHASLDLQSIDLLIASQTISSTTSIPSERSSNRKAARS
jgi:DNA-binding SARP family transcriptional activator